MKATFTLLATCLFVIAACNNDRPVTSPAERTVIEPFQFSIRNNGMIRDEIFETFISESKIWVVQGNGADSLRFNTPIPVSDSLNRISETTLTTLDSLYSNDCIADGLQLTALFNKRDTTKTVHISNFYHPDIGRAIEYLNTYVPAKFRIIYDQKKLEEDYIKCKEASKSQQ
jgi:hypothetical protein